MSDEVTTANGDMYHAYRKTLFQLLQFAGDTIEASLSSRRLPQAYQLEMSHAVHRVRSSTESFQSVLPALFDEANPSFVEECQLESLLGLLESVFAAGQFVGMNNAGARKLVKLDDTSRAVQEKAAQDLAIKEGRLRVLRDFIAGRSIKAHSKFVIGHLDEINAAASSADVKQAGKSTWTDLMVELGFSKRQKKSNIVSPGPA